MCIAQPETQVYGFPSAPVDRTYRPLHPATRDITTQRLRDSQYLVVGTQQFGAQLSTARVYIDPECTSGEGKCPGDHHPFAIAGFEQREPIPPQHCQMDGTSISGIVVVALDRSRMDKGVMLDTGVVKPQRVALNLLKFAGYEADVAENGSEAIKAVQKNAYKLVLMDLQLLLVDGFEATRRIRALPEAHQPIIIALTANVQPSDRTASLEAGMDEFLPKPLDFEELQNTIAKLVRTPEA